MNGNDDFQQLRQKVDQMKTTKSKVIVAVNIDHLLEVAIEKFRLLLATVIPYVKDVFNSCDVFY